MIAVLNASTSTSEGSEPINLSNESQLRGSPDEVFVNANRVVRMELALVREASAATRTAPADDLGLSHFGLARRMHVDPSSTAPECQSGVAEEILASHRRTATVPAAGREPGNRNPSSASGRWASTPRRQSPTSRAAGPTGAPCPLLHMQATCRDGVLHAAPRRSLNL